MALFGNKKTDEKKPVAKTAKAVKPKETAAPASMQELYSDAPKNVKTASGKKVAPARFGNSYRILIKPLVTEKASILGAENKYVFVVNPTANKISVAKAVADTYGVHPTQVNIIKSKGKFVTRGRISGQRSDSKKAIVTLPKGETIKIYEGV